MRLSKLIDQRSRGALSFHAASLYPLLYRLEKREWIQGLWVEKGGQRRRRYYQLTAQGREVLARPKAGLAELRGSDQPDHGSRKCLIGSASFESASRS
ncbi:MAG: helix-turn-helix transcriptional regulator [Ignavibacteriota bacterium]